MESNPGPRVGRVGSNLDLITVDVTEATARKYLRAVERFEGVARMYDDDGLEGLLRAEGVSKAVGFVCKYLRQQFTNGAMSSGQAGEFVSAIRRYFLIAAASGYEIPDIKAVLKPMWRQHRSWVLQIPPEFRCPVSHEVTLAMSVWAYLEGYHTFPTSDVGAPLLITPRGIERAPARRRFVRQ